MKKLILVCLIAAITSCSSVTIGYDYDKAADFTKYKTYAFTEDALNLPVDQLNRDRILRAVETEMTAKGFSKSDSPDVLIDLQVKAKQEMDATATNTGGGMYGGRYGFGGGYGYGGTTRIDYNEYTVGSLFVNMVDKSTEKIVWQGRGSKTINENASATQRDTNITNGVKQIFTQYPPKK
ncbi:MAG TPA: DUF4136 domain-containing protein [Chryseolinea sp.]|nr:DUF4136 domain-containing protein [Chryseolinea sp.]